MATSVGRMIDVSNSVQARRVRIGASEMVQVYEGTTGFTLSVEALRMLLQLARDDEVGECRACHPESMVHASRAERRYVQGEWVWTCADCGIPLVTSYPF
jgi:hypothetical protein